jgi:extracellular factor (EF) 3-hydroxypalmitic acid methyl ester biosynthesis protein
MENAASKESMVVCRTNQGIGVRGGISRLTRHAVTFEVYNPSFVLQTSEVLTEFNIILSDRTVYSGRAVIASVINSGTTIVCEATLDESGLDLEAARSGAGDARELRAGFEEFLRDWGKNYKVRPEFKVLLSDIQSFLMDLRLWMERVELGIRSLPAAERTQAEQRAARDLSAIAMPAVGALFEKFEDATRDIKEELQPAHRAFCRRLLHPYLLCSPFMNRIYVKPLGYAGDYEMVSMILRDPYEGGSLYAKILNGFILNQAPAVAHRNRITFLTQRLIEETNRKAQRGQKARIFNIGCGPAMEIQNFLRQHPLSNHAEFTLLDANDETLLVIGQTLEEIKRKNHRQTPVKLVKKSVQQLLKQAYKPKADGPEFDFIYCAGLFDYLPDFICEKLLETFYNMLVPGGLLVATNVDPYNPIKNIMEYIFEWHLIYRTGQELGALAPKLAPADAISITAEPTSSNVFIEVRKPLPIP